MLPRFFVTLPLMGAVVGQVVSFVGFTPSVVAVAERVAAGWGDILDIADGEAGAVDGAVLGLADMAGEGATAVSSGFLPQLDSPIATESAHTDMAQTVATERVLK